MTILFLLAFLFLSFLATITLLAALCASARRGRIEPDAELEEWVRRLAEATS